MIRDSIALAKDRKGEAMYDAEHFFDGFKANPDYALSCVTAAAEAGARWVVLCDTNGGTLPHEVFDIVTTVVKKVPGERLGIHAHNDTENAVANSLAPIVGAPQRCSRRHAVGVAHARLVGEILAAARVVAFVAGSAGVRFYGARVGARPADALEDVGALLVAGTVGLVRQTTRTEAFLVSKTK